MDLKPHEFILFGYIWNANLTTLVFLGITAFAALVGNFYVLFSAAYKNWYYRPKLVPKFKNGEPWINYLIINNSIVRHYRLSILNQGRRVANNTETRVEKIIHNSTHTEWYHPTLLKWSGKRNFVTVNIPRGSHFLLDFFHIDSNHTWFVWVDSPKIRGIPVKYQCQGNYEIHLFITERDTKPVKFIVKLDWTIGKIIRSNGTAFPVPDVILECQNEITMIPGIISNSSTTTSSGGTSSSSDVDA